MGGIAMRKRRPRMDEGQMKYMYATAANPRRQISILAELNQVDEDTIKEAIGIKPKSPEPKPSESPIAAAPEKPKKPGSGRSRQTPPGVVYTICELHREGYSYKEISELVKKGYNTVYIIVQREVYGITYKKKSRHGAATP